MIDGVEHVSNLITRYTILETIYLDILTSAKPAAHDQLQSSLTKLYAAILAYLAKARRYYDKSTAGEQPFFTFHINQLEGWILSTCRACGKCSYPDVRINRRRFSRKLKVLRWMSTPACVSSMLRVSLLLTSNDVSSC